MSYVVAGKLSESHRCVQCSFLQSDTIKSFVGFILAANASVEGKSNSAVQDVSTAVQALVAMLETLSAWVDEIPPVKQSLRYGNPAYRSKTLPVPNNSFIAGISW